VSRPEPTPLLENLPDPQPTDGRRARGMRSRAAILDRSVQMASSEGLEGLTIGELAAELELPKSSVFALFGSKEDLQLATLAAARGILIDCVVVPAIPADKGAQRLRALGEAWCDYLVSNVFAGGCFLCAASAEMDGRPGPVRDAVAEVMREWITVLATNVKAAVASGEFDSGLDPKAMAFRLNALGMAANWQRQLFDDASGVEHARTAWRAEIDNALS
jgi:AcrR family transcriptional regulator